MTPVTIAQLLEAVSTQRVSLLMGAGCSVSGGVPLAKGIAEDLQAGREGPEETYFGAMQALSPIERRELFERYIQRARINVSSFVAARLLCERHIDCVITTNFDDLVPRAVGLSVRSVPIYDATLAIPQGGFDITRPSIVYLHGQVHGLWQLNTDGEFGKCAGAVRQLLRDAIRGTAVVVLGYSGNDHVVEILAEEMKHTFGIYWVQFRREPVSDRVAKAFAGTDGFTCVEDNLTADSTLYALAKHYGVLETYNSKFFSELLKELSNIASEVELGDGLVDVLGRSKNRIAVAKDVYEDNAIQVTKAAREHDGRWDDLVGVASEFDHEMRQTITAGWRMKPDRMMAVARMLRTIARGSGVSSVMNRAIAWALLASDVADVKQDDVAIFIATALSELGKISRDAKAFADAQPYYAQAVAKADNEQKRISAIGNWAMSRHDLANVHAEDSDASVSVVETLLCESRLMFESVIAHPAATAKLVNNYSSLLIDMGRMLNRPELFEAALAEAARANEAVYGAGAYNLASCYALMAKPEIALIWIERAIGARRHRREQFMRDPDFLSLRDDPRFMTLVHPEVGSREDGDA